MNFKLVNDGWIIILGIFIISMARYIVIPFIAIYLVSNMHFSVTASGVAVAARIWGQRGLAIFGGLLVDWLGYKLAIQIALLFMCVSYFMLAYSTNLVMVITWIIISGFGGACYVVATKSILAKGLMPEEKVFIFSLRTTALSLGCAIGPLLGMLVFAIKPKLIFIVTSIIIGLLGLLTQFILKGDTGIKKIQHSKIAINSLFEILYDKAFIKIILFTILFYIFYIQFELTYPLFANFYFHNGAVSIIFLLNALVVASSQILLSTFIGNHSIKYNFIIGMIFIASAFFITYFTQKSQIVFYVAIVIFSYGEIFILPKLDSEVTNHISQNRLGSAFGITGLASAIGAAIGSALGGYFYNNGAVYCWLWLTILIVITIGAIYKIIN